MLKITKRPTAANSAIRLHPADNVAVARVPLAPGTELRIDDASVTVRDSVPAGHKVAVAGIAATHTVLRYGHSIGRAKCDIVPGQHVHTHNLVFEELQLTYDYPTVEIQVPARPDAIPTFLGYPREDGRVGTRNYVAVVAASNCAAHAAELIAGSFQPQELPEGIDGVVAFPHGEGCGHSIGPDTEQLHRTLSGVLRHPNVCAAVILGLGCEMNQVDHYLGSQAAMSNRLVGMTLQQAGGTRGTVEAARKQIIALMTEGAREQRVPVPVSKIVLGLNCGGSDSFSGITANPALGHCSDMLARLGASVVLAETPEIFGAEDLLVRRARNRHVAEKLLGFICWYKQYLTRLGGSFDDNPTPGNKEGGLSNILEKSLGAVAKAGSSSLMDAIDYAERIESSGFVFMNTPGYDPVSLTGLAAGGANLIAFTTGRGSAIGFPSIPVIKIASNTHTYLRMQDNMDINAGTIADGEKSVAEVGEEIFQSVLRVASGEKTCAERLGHKEFVPWRIGPVL